MNIWQAMARAQEEDGVSGYDLVNREDSFEIDSSEDSEDSESKSD